LLCPLIALLFSGAVAAQLHVDTPVVNFGQVDVGESSPDTEVNLVNHGSAPVALSCGGGAASAPFNSVQNCAGKTLNPGESCQWIYSFTPDGTGPFTGSSNFTCNGVPMLVSLFGIGMLAEPTVIVTPVSGLVTTESGESDFFEVSLGTQPTSDVFVSTVSDNPVEGETEPLLLTFTPLNWYQPQVVTVTGVDDYLLDGDQLYLVANTTSSGDGDYDGIETADVEVVNIGDGYVYENIPDLGRLGSALLALMILALSASYLGSRINTNKYE
jgi:hypothetical protein